MSLELNGVSVIMEVDTGAKVSLMSVESQRHFFPKAVLEKPTVCLTTYTTGSISIVGMMTVQVKYLSYKGTHTLYMVQGHGPTLLDQDSPFIPGTSSHLLRHASRLG